MEQNKEKREKLRSQLQDAYQQFEDDHNTFLEVLGDFLNANLWNVKGSFYDVADAANSLWVAAGVAND